MLTGEEKAKDKREFKRKMRQETALKKAGRAPSPAKGATRPGGGAGTGAGAEEGEGAPAEGVVQEIGDDGVGGSQHQTGRVSAAGSVAGSVTGSVAGSVTGSVAASVAGSAAGGPKKSRKEILAEARAKAAMAHAIKSDPGADDTLFDVTPHLPPNYPVDIIGMTLPVVRLKRRPMPSRLQTLRLVGNGITDEELCRLSDNLAAASTLTDLQYVCHLAVHAL